MKVAVIGGGWYGCHIALELIRTGYDVTLFEKNDRLLSEASGNNQYRLHRGYHYPRHYGTRMQSRDGFRRFVERYPELSREVPDNLYAVVEERSLMDASTYHQIMWCSGLKYDVLHEHEYIRNVESIFRADERVLLTSKARDYFTTRLGDRVRLDTHVSPSALPAFDYIVDATWGHFRPLPADVYYEPTLLLYYETRETFPAVTLVDGALCSVYPTEDTGVYTLSSVELTPLGICKTAYDARAVKDCVGEEEIWWRRHRMEDEISHYIPGFRDIFRYAGPQLSIKTKVVGSAADRACRVYREGNVLSVLSGKIDGVFFAADQILGMLA